MATRIDWGLSANSQAKKIFKQTFESVNKNLNSLDITWIVQNSQWVITSVRYWTGTKLVVKTISTNDNGNVNRVTLSWDIPSYVDNVKNIAYNSQGNVTGITYSMST